MTLLNSITAAAAEQSNHESIIRLQDTASQINAAVSEFVKQVITFATSDHYSNYQAIRTLMFSAVNQILLALDRDMTANAELVYERLRESILRYMPADLAIEWFSENAGKITLAAEHDTGSLTLGYNLDRPLITAVQVRNLTKKQLRAAMKRWLLPPIDREQIRGILRPVGLNWPDVLKTSLAPPDILASIVTQGISRGYTRAQVIRDIRPHVDNVRSTAVRIARDTGSEIANRIRMQTYQSMGTLVIGFMLRAVISTSSRPWHAARHGQKYYKQPEPGQLGVEHMPHPPYEPNIAPWNGQIAHNCRCIIVPVFRQPRLVNQQTMQAIRDKTANLVPDVASYSDWFEKADERLRRTAVGSRRYSLMRAKLDHRAPQWTDFLNPETSELCSLDWLEKETSDERKARASLARRLVNQRRSDLLAHVRSLGID